MSSEDVQKHSVHTLVFRSLKRTHDMFLADQGNTPLKDDLSLKVKRELKVQDEYGPVKEMVKRDARSKQLHQGANGDLMNGTEGDSQGTDHMRLGGSLDADRSDPNRALVAVNIGQQQMLVPKKAPTMPKPNWHPPWKLYRVISGHIGWVRCLAVEPGNSWFCSGAGDRVIKIWDLASGTLKLTLTGHVSTVRGVAVSARQPYLFSCGEDKMVKCWDLEQNKTIRHYHGHLSACYGLDLHPTLDILTTCGRDGTVRVWDIRTKASVHTMVGHTNTVAEVKCQSAEPQVISGSHDCTVRLWDLAMGRTRVTLTNHKKSVRALALHPSQYAFASGSPDNVKQWKFPDGNFMQNLSGHNAIINSLACNSDGVLVSAADNGSMHFWDWKTGYNFQRIQAAVQPGSIHSEAGIFSLCYDQSGSRLITGEADKTIKIYKEDDTATEETHPINWRPDIYKKKKY
uniref:Pleiotropic regulator 1 n=1 Tax=Arion vulgaris TaxID=1028688 RepID=A0A0B6ZZT2_9EUPU